MKFLFEREEKEHKITYLQQQVTDDISRQMSAFLLQTNLFCKTPIKVHSCAALSPASHLVLSASSLLSASTAWTVEMKSGGL